ncbi:hypothetical protein PUN28_013956 [Cardiocondyla obscurior]|uniref:Uncharacterized protein n=1 Tax=Cardiocondyla obscurior TaxID=286306 RepID=A0AAW2F920_9HYME
MNLTRQQPTENLRPVPSGPSTHHNLANSTPSRLLTNTITYTTPDITQTAPCCKFIPTVSQSNNRSLIYPSFEIDLHLFPSNSKPPSKSENYHPFTDLDFLTSISRQPTVVSHPKKTPLPTFPITIH